MYTEPPLNSPPRRKRRLRINMPTKSSSEIPRAIRRKGTPEGPFVQPSQLEERGEVCVAIAVFPFFFLGVSFSHDDVS